MARPRQNNARCPSPPGTLLRLNLGPTELDLLGLQVSIPTGLCLIVRAGTLDPIVQRHLARKLRQNGGRLVVRGNIVNDGRSKTKIKVSNAPASSNRRRSSSRSRR